MDFKNALDTVLPTITLNTPVKYGLDWRIIEEAEALVLGL